MRSRTSFFNRTVFFSDLRHWWPLTAGYALLWFLILPLTRLTELNHDRDLSPWNMRYDALDLAAHAGYWIAFFTAILFAMAAFAYLTNSRATYGLHALPARRETLYATHYLAGLGAQLVPQLLAVLLTAEVLASHGAFSVRAAWLMLLALVLPTLFFYSFGVLCMMFTGQILAAPVYYFVLNFLVVGVEVLLRGFAGSFLYGWAGSADPALIAFSPLLKMLDVGTDGSAEYIDEAGKVYRAQLSLAGLDWLLLYAAVGLVFAVLALLLYRTRHSEATGSTVAIGWARPIFKYGVTFCTALALGQLLYYLFFGQYRANGDYSLPGTLACMAAASLIGYFAAEMLLKKSFRVWKSGWKGAAAVTLALMLLGVVMSFDLWGFERYIPDATQLKSAQIVWNGISGSQFTAEVSDAETLRLLTQAHRAVAADKQRQLAIDRSENSVFSEPDSGAQVTSGSFEIEYRFQSGRTLSRYYGSFVIWESELGTPGSPAAALTALYNAPDVVLQRSLNATGPDPAYRLADLRFTGGFCYEARYSDRGRILDTVQRELTAAEAKAVFDAIVRDAEAGRVRDSLFGSVPELRTLELYATRLPDEGDLSGKSRRERTFLPRVTEQMTDTITVLKEIGAEITLFE